jgi:hypothetical protein
VVALLIAFVLVAGWFLADLLQRRALDLRTRNSLEVVARAVARARNDDRATARSLP